MDEETLRRRLAWTLQAWQVSREARIAAVSRTCERLEKGRLSAVLSRHVRRSGVRVRRLLRLCSRLHVPPAEKETFAVTRELSSFSVDLSTSEVTCGNVGRSALPSLFQMTVIEHGLIAYARSVCEMLADTEAARRLRRVEAELSRLMAALQSAAAELTGVPTGSIA